MLRSQRLALMQAARWCSVRSLQSSRRRGPYLHELWINATCFLIIWWYDDGLFSSCFQTLNIARSSWSTTSWHSHSVAGWPFADLQYASTTSRTDAIVRCQAKESFCTTELTWANRKGQNTYYNHITLKNCFTILDLSGWTLELLEQMLWSRRPGSWQIRSALVEIPARMSWNNWCGVNVDWILSECCTFLPEQGDFSAGQRSDWWSWSRGSAGEERPSWRPIRQLEWLCHGLHIWILEIEQSQRDRWPFEPCGGQRDHEGIEQAPGF